MRLGREGGDGGWDGWMASLTGWTWVWASSSSWWWTGKPSALQSMGSQSVGHDWVADCTELITNIICTNTTMSWFLKCCNKSLSHNVSTPFLSISYLCTCICILEDFPGGSDSNKLACNPGDLDLISALGRSPGEENGNPLQYSCLENSMDRVA